MSPAALNQSCVPNRSSALLEEALLAFKATPGLVDNLSLRTKHLLSLVLRDHGNAQCVQQKRDEILQTAQVVEDEVRSLIEAGRHKWVHFEYTKDEWDMTNTSISYEDPIEGWDTTVPYWAR